MQPATRSRADKIGLPPGTLVHVGERKTEEVVLSVIDYDAEHVTETRINSPEEIRAYLERNTVTWVNLTGVQDVEVVRSIGSIFGVHPLALEDIVNTHQRPKAEDHDGHLFIVLKMVHYDRETAEVEIEQVSLILGPKYVVTFQEKTGDVFDPIRERIRTGKGRVRKNGADYLAYAFLDVVVDHYFLALEGLGEAVEGMEDELLSNPRPETLQSIHALKRQMITLRKAVWPLRELAAAIERSESALMTRAIQPYLRDVYDHTIQVIDTVETFRDILSGYVDIYLSSVSNRMNEVIKVLTVIATIFIPLTFLAGVYGMNFEYMPELKWPWAYPTLWILMVGVGAAMLLSFRRKRWL